MSRSTDKLLQTWLPVELSDALDLYIAQKGTNRAIELRNAVKKMLALEGELNKLKKYERVT